MSNGEINVYDCFYLWADGIILLNFQDTGHNIFSFILEK